jgi:uncharacterized protein
MMNLKPVLQLLEARQADLKRCGVNSLAVFGLAARGESSHDSNLDVLVEFDRPVGLFEFIHLKYMLEDLTGCRVDLVTPDALRPALRETILSEAVCVA